ncbi:MAG: hypothetical protein HY816_23190, partial [Candidatus Wallbacteria bacterium]|nr:hypothetical protein [Candidatus Wallbacteria bacterium]
MKGKRLWFVGMVVVMLLGLGQTAHAELNAVGPTDPEVGFPLWYQDPALTACELCLEQPSGPSDPCGLAGTIPFPGQPISVPANSPEEMFWHMATALTPTPAGSALLVLALEAAFANGP